MLARMISVAKELINEAQTGFTEGRGKVEQISNIRLINEKYRASKYVYHNFMISKRLSTEFVMKHYGKQC